MSWQKYFTVVPQNQLLNNKLLQYNKDNLNDSSVSALGNKYSSFLPEIYSGNPNRIQRYVQYDQMDMDSEISSALDTLADFCSQIEEQSGVPFELDYSDKINETEVQILQTSLKQWVKINQFNRRLWRIFRNILKYGDQFFIRDPETSELYWVDHNKVDGVKVAENEGKKPAVYLVRDLDLNLQSMTATSTQSLGQTYTGMPVLGTPAKYTAQGMPSSGLLTPAANPLTSRNGASGSMQQYEVDARHMVHLSLSEGMDINWPFGTSILESIFKTYKQKELLEDAIIIYRIQRAPERRIFYIDVGNMPPHKAMAHIERVKNEIHQRRIPNRCLDLNTKIKLIDGRSLTLKDIINEYENGKINWVYSCNPSTGKIVPGPITWAGITKKNEKVIKITFDNEESVTCTPDHKFPILNKGFVEAQYLEIGESMIAGYTRESFIIDSKKETKSIEIFDNETKEWIFVDKMIENFFSDHSNNLVEMYDYNQLQNYKNKNIDHTIFSLIKDHYYKILKESKNNLVELNKLHQSIQSEKNIKLNSIEKTIETFGFKNYEDFSKKYQYLNHKIVSIEEVDYGIDVGTITVDGNEEYHNYHTFLLGCGVFTKNSGGGISIQDAAYNPLSILEDYFFANTSDGRGSKVETLAGGESIGEISDLKYFNHKLTRGLGIPIAYMPSGPEDANVAFTDGRVGTAYIQEFRFGKRCQRLQNLISWVFDNEFKLFVKLRGIDIESNLYELRFNKPENFSKYRQIELDSAQLALISNLFDVPFLSKRFVMERYMNLNQEEMLRNERMWKEENPKKVKNAINTEGTSLGLGAIGVKSGFADSTLPGEPSPDMTGLEPATGVEPVPTVGASETGTEPIEA